MKNTPTPKKGDGSSSLIGERTPAKLSGLTYSVSACTFFFLSLAMAMLPRGAEDKPTPQWLVYAGFLVAQIAFAVVAVWYFYYTKTPIKTFAKEQKCHPKYYGIALLLQLGLLSLGELNGLFLRFLQRFGYENPEMVLPNTSGGRFVGVLFVIAVLPAFFEELFFRGLLLRDMKGFSVAARVLLCGGLFALYHQNPAQTVYQFACGACFALVAIRAGSFLPTVLSHLINNALILLLYKCEITSYGQPTYAIMLTVSAICLMGSLTYLLFFDGKKTQKKTSEKGAFLQFFLCAAVGITVFAVSWIATLVTGF